MKKLLTLSLVFASAIFFAQGKLYMQNFSNYKLLMRAVASNPSNCLPTAIASMTFPAATTDLIENFNDTGAYTAGTAGWSVKTSPTGSYVTQSVPSGLLTAISPLTRWQFIWFQAVDPVTNQGTDDNVVFNMGDMGAFPSCPWTSSTFVDGIYTDAFWFYMPTENTTYLIVQ